ncbi:hypothetical protein LJ707_15120 [Mucilaginibacter sp. UR6-1]|uniref:hypothetical protein n=1 Tax=Mucilaginibacter sp. UR6-1 TaxID=1435643 RepID=UPI001E5A4CC7|nr:hypothetical protein [Mucilaginibacter sp. UR6-1]MCC8410271.1 hypothetical protein [Mucilaginibacter sp. UR6-1]
MKHYLLLCAAIVLLFPSCSKEKRVSPDSGEKKYPVKFDVSGFTQIYEPQGGATGKVRTADVDSLPVTNLSFVVFKDNDIVSIKGSKKGDAGFGTFSENLAAGNYIIAFSGGAPGNVSTEELLLDPEVEQFVRRRTPLLNGSDLFYKKYALTVKDTTITQNVLLNRITSQLVININDAIPAGVTSITVALKDSIDFIMLQSKYLRFDDRYVSNTIAATDAGKTNYRLFVSSSHNITPFSITISYVQNGETFSKIIPNVICKTNMRTILSGNLFSSNSNEFKMKIGSEWFDPIYIDF